MRVPKNTEKNARKLADACVEYWDMDTLVEFASNILTERYVHVVIGRERRWLVEFTSNILTERYLGDTDLFKRDWKDTFDNVNDQGLPR
jgi:hypothetical protein